MDVWKLLTVYLFLNERKYLYRICDRNVEKQTSSLQSVIQEIEILNKRVGCFVVVKAQSI